MKDSQIVASFMIYIVVSVLSIGLDSVLVALERNQTTNNLIVMVEPSARKK